MKGYNIRIVIEIDISRNRRTDTHTHKSSLEEPQSLTDCEDNNVLVYYYQWVLLYKFVTNLHFYSFACYLCFLITFLYLLSNFSCIYVSNFYDREQVPALWKMTYVIWNRGTWGEISILRKMRKNKKNIHVILKFEILPLIVP